MGMLLERLERLPRSATPTQYRDVVTKVQGLLAQVEPGIALDALLNALPATAELYENASYAQAGLCRSQQAAAFESERAVRQVMALISGASGKVRRD